MTPASNDEFLIISLLDLPKLGGALARFTPHPGTTSSAIYRFEGAIPTCVQCTMREVGVVERCLFDRAHFLLNSDPKLQQAAYGEFFEYIAAEYESLIDLDRNVRNVDNLIAMLCRSIEDLYDKRILDFGCGTGLSYGSLKRSTARFIGVDQSQHMRKIAQSRGMQVLGLDYLGRAQSTFDGAIASYVLHLVTDETVVGSLVNSMKPGGILVANYHKGINADWAENTFRRLGCDVTGLPSAESGEHGPYFAYIKR